PRARPSISCAASAAPSTGWRFSSSWSRSTDARGWRTSVSTRFSSTDGERVIVLAAAAVIAGAVIWAARMLRAEALAARDDARRERILAMPATFAPAVAAAQSDPRALLAWHPVAHAARGLFPDEFAAIDRAAGAPFPYSPERVQAVHAQWTADWLAWER